MLIHNNIINVNVSAETPLLYRLSPLKQVVYADHFSQSRFQTSDIYNINSFQIFVAVTFETVC